MKANSETSSPETFSLQFPKELVIRVKYLPKSRNVERRMHWRNWQKEKRRAWVLLAYALYSAGQDSSMLTLSTRRILSMAWLKLVYYLGTKSVKSSSSHWNRSRSRTGAKKKL